MLFVTCLDDGTKYGFTARTPYEAMQSMFYTLNITCEDNTAVINETPSGLHLWMEHTGKTYCIKY